jgi:hypothetical protein
MSKFANPADKLSKIASEPHKELHQGTTIHDLAEHLLENNKTNLTITE